MAVWVDDMRISKNGQIWCHLVADNWQEMHDFCLQQLHLARTRFHAKAKLPHYDLTWAERERALQLGALPINRRQLVAKSRFLKSTMD